MNQEHVSSSELLITWLAFEDNVILAMKLTQDIFRFLILKMVPKDVVTEKARASVANLTFLAFEFGDLTRARVLLHHMDHRCER